MQNNNMRFERRRRRRRRPPPYPHTEEIAIAEQLPERRGKYHLESKLWNFNTFVSGEEDSLVACQVASRLQDERARQALRERERAKQEELELKKKKDQLLLIQLIHRYGACPGDIYCSATFKGKAYLELLRARASQLVFWWRSINNKRRL